MVLMFLTLAFVAADKDNLNIISEAFDLRQPNARTDGNDHYVIFSARATDLLESDIGHCWVTWLKMKPNKEVIEQDCFGFYPGKSENKGKQCAFECPPAIVNELYRAEFRGGILRETHRLILHVDQIPYLKSKQVLGDWSKKADKYDLLSNSCKHFCFDVAKSFRLNQPVSETDLPDTFLLKLIEQARKEYGASQK